MNKINAVLVDWWNSDRDIAESAWVSTHKNDPNRPDEDVKRIIENNIVPLSHDTPKESVWFRFYLHIPIFVERQLDKYRMTTQKQNMTIEYEHGEFGRLGITQNELSLRYKTMPNTYIQLPEDILNILDKMHKDNRNYFISSYINTLKHESDVYDTAISLLKNEKDAGNITYNDLKRVREVFRGVLGTSFFTDMQLILNLNALEHIFNQRLKDEAQPETRLTCKLMLEEIIKNNIIPITIGAMIEKNGWNN